MVRITQGLGALLVVVGVVAYVGSGAESPTALLPAVLGVVVGVLGVLAQRDGLHRHAIHAALAVALLGLLGTLMQVAGIPDLLAGDAERPVAVVAGTITAVACLAYVALGVRSFVSARRAPVAE